MEEKTQGQDNRQMDIVADKLKEKFDDSSVTDEDVADAVRESAEEFKDAPVQTFTPLVVENEARNRLQEQDREQS